jgi:choline-glycine betaine transporter
MSLRSIPLMVIPFILYFVIVVFGPTGVESAAVMSTEILRPVTLPSGAVWRFSWGDLIMVLTLLMLFIEVVKSTHQGTSTTLDHGLSMLMFIVCLISFGLLKPAGSSAFFFLTMAGLIDVVAGYTIAIGVARKSLNMGTDN